MKRTFAVITLFLAFAFASKAQEKESRFDIDLGFGFCPQVQCNRVVDYSNTYGTLASIYEPLRNRVRVSGAFSLEGSYRYGKRTTLSAMVGYCRLMGSTTLQSYTVNGVEYVNASASDDSGYSLSALVNWKYDWICKPAFHLYSSIGVGMGYYRGFQTGDVYEDYVSTEMMGECQVVPVGFTLGRKLYWLMEAGIGTQYMGGRTGVGFRF